MSDLKCQLEAIRQKYNIPSLAVAVTVDGQLDGVAATGVRRSDQPDNHVHEDDQFHFGSCGKALTAALIHSLADDGKLALDTTLAQLFPDTPLHDKFKGVTISQILTHSAGFTEMPGPTPTDQQMSDPQELRKLLEPAAKLPAMLAQLSNPPKYENSTAHYSNFGYALLGHIAEKAGGKPYEQLVQEHIFNPLDMKSAGFGMPTSKDAPLGHRDGKPSTLDIYPPEFAAAGHVHASVTDWLKFVTWDMQQPRLANPSASAMMEVEPGVIAKYTDSAMMDYGNGVFAHDGSNGLNLTRQLMMPKMNSGFVISATEASENSKAALNEAAQLLTEHVVDKLLEKREQTASFPKWSELPRNTKDYRAEGMSRKPPGE